MNDSQARPKVQDDPKADDSQVLARRIEEASLNAWPSIHQVLLDGWLLRFAGGFTKRANSIIPLYPSLQPSLEKIRYCENLYAREKLQTMFRLTSLIEPTSLDETLKQRRYSRMDPTSVLQVELSQVALDESSDGDEAGIRTLNLQEWLTAYCTLSGMPDTASRLHGLLLKAIRTDATFVARYHDDEVVACGLAVIERELVGLYDILTHPAHRRVGHGRALVRSLLRRGAEIGARRAYLQVMDDNKIAQNLYEQLGFELIYRYWYRTSPTPTGA